MQAFTLQISIQKECPCVQCFVCPTHGMDVFLRIRSSGIPSRFVSRGFSLSHVQSFADRPVILVTESVTRNRFLTHMFTTVCYVRGHVTLDCKNSEPQGFGSEEILGIQIFGLKIEESGMRDIP